MTEASTDGGELRRLTVTADPDLATTPHGERERLDHYLGRQWEDLSRSRLEALIREGRVRVDGKVPKASRTVSTGQSIEVEVPPAQVPEARPEAIPLTVVYEDADLIVVDKPAGLVVHPAPGHPSGTLVNALLHHCGDLSGIGGELRPGIVHRLDRHTSGLLVAAKSQRAHINLAEALRQRRVERVYLAVVWGSPEPPEGEVVTWIGRSRRDRRRMAAFLPRRPALDRRWGRPGEEEWMRAVREELKAGGPAAAEPPGADPSEDDADLEESTEPDRPPGIPPDARTALTRYRVTGAFRYASRLECTLATGRTHQIRVHLAHLGHPVVGDPLYGGRENAVRGLASEVRVRAQEILALIDRQALHARQLAFTHPVDGRDLVFESPPPADLQRLLDHLELS
jgi:23S rRNA pseudouridine1911/1915/1917 synthase